MSDLKWTLAPKEPTDEMVAAGVAAFTNVRDIYKAMLAARPELDDDTFNQIADAVWEETLWSFYHDPTPSTPQSPEKQAQ